MKYRFWGWEHADTKAITAEYKGIETPVVRAAVLPMIM